MDVVVSVILPVYNAEAWLDDAFSSIFEQTFIQQGGLLVLPRSWRSGRRLEVSVYDDASSDKSLDKIREWQKKFEVYNNVKSSVLLVDF